MIFEKPLYTFSYLGMKHPSSELVVYAHNDDDGRTLSILVHLAEST